ncbi:FKBP-type peptidyl-prolyl cis-trans isomerase [Catalinimonas alkaloidigena]|uniref:FKBP-type peptidyl-prolyl cis-trans isomerase n=1 Tax=Catalinimonas alkaloidigena TaxID=1075417 RepID=UPI00240567DB|nr:FKBP-type peptidyl-prolyl cis-trans isomerase [Catalinimonas alkaloidigena]MDF9800205.1 FKBP-type peptidyl-prolyl cis-trans isomerase [Catalinimonas alkaloidigena]
MRKLLKNTLNTLLLVATGLLFFGCSEEEDPNTEVEERLEAQILEIENYLADNGIAKNNVNGYYLESIVENEDGEAPGTNDVVGIYYELLTLDGQLIEKLEETQKSEPEKLLFDPSRVFLPGVLYEVISNMREGEEVRTYLPFNTAYGGFSIENKLPAFSAVIMKVKLAEVLNEEEQRMAEDARIKTYLAENGFSSADSLEGGVYYAETQAGESPEVDASSTVQLRYTGSFLDGTEFDSNTDAAQAFAVNMSENRVISGFKTAISEMSLNEEGTAIIPSHEAYGSGLFAMPYELIEDLYNQGYVNDPTFIEIKPYSILRFDLEVEGIN